MGSINALAPGQSAGLSAVQMAQTKAAQALDQQARDNEEFGALMVEMGRQQLGFSLVVRAKQEEMKSMTDIVRDSIRKGAER